MKLFLDSSVIIAALLSETGGSAKLFMLSEGEVLDIFISRDVIAEVEHVLRRKLPDTLPFLESLIAKSKCHVVTAATLQAINKAKLWISDGNDAKILVAAKKAKVDYLITLDIHDFIKDKKVAMRSGLKILTPGDFLQQIFGQ